MKNKFILVLVLAFLLNPILGNACSMYKITRNGKTIVGNNEDWLSPNSQFWFEAGEANNYGVMYMGLLNDFAQGAINDAGLVFDVFANPDLPIENTEGKLDISISVAIRKIMQTMSTVEEVETYLKTINLSSLSSSQIVFVDQSGTYLIVEGDEFIAGDESEKAFSNFYYSQIESVEEVDLENFQNGLKFLNSSEGNASTPYCSDAMKHLANNDLFGTQYSTIYDLNTLKIRVYLFHDYSQFIDLDLTKELKKGNHKVMIADLFPKDSIGYKHYNKYNNEEHPTLFLEELIASSPETSEKEWMEMGINSIINMIGYEWLNDKDNAKAAVKIFEYGTELMPGDANLFDSLGEAYFENGNTEQAALNFKKSLTLNPDNKNAAEFLAKIKLEKQV